ncbi:MAG: helix-turn-helix domain-containing protein [Anaerolineales bacterium]
MSVKVSTRVWEKSTRGGAELLLLLALADWADDWGYCYPSIDQIAKKIHQTRRNVIRLIQKLEDSGAIRTLTHAQGGRGVKLGSVYQVTLGLSEAEIAESERLSPLAKKIAVAQKTSDKMSPVSQKTGDILSPVSAKTSDKLSPVLPESAKTGDISGPKMSPVLRSPLNVLINVKDIKDPVEEVVQLKHKDPLSAPQNFLTAAASSSPSGEAQSVLTDADFPNSPLAQPAETTNAPTSLDAEALYRKLRPTHVTVPGSDPAAFRTLKRYLALYHNCLDRAAEALRPFVEEADRRGIRQTNLCWLTEWAAAGHIPPTSQNTGRYKREMARPLNSAPPPAAQPLPRYEYDPNNLPWEWKPRIYDEIVEYMKQTFSDTWRHMLQEEGAEHLLQTVSKRLPADLAVGSTLRVELADGEVVAGPVTEMRYSTLFPQYLTHLVIGGEEVDALDLVYAKDIRGGDT